MVVSPLEYNQRVGLAIVCPVTKWSKGYPFEVTLPDNLEISGVVLADQIKSLDWRARKAQIVCKAPEPITAEVLGKVVALLS